MLQTLTKPLAEGGAGLTEADAVDVYFFEMENLALVAEINEREKLDADFWRGERLEVFTSDEGVRANEATLQSFNAAQAKTRHRDKPMECGLLRGDDAVKRSRISNALQVNTVPAGSWHPHRGVTALMRRALEGGAQLFSWTPVMGLTRRELDWDVDCGARGTVTAANVILATNGYTRYLTEGDMAQQ